MLCPATNTGVIGRLRIRSKSPDPQAAGQRLRHILSNASLSPAGLPPFAILVVRKLADPLPSRLRVNQFDLQPDPAWQKAMVSELEDLLARTIRPAFQAVPAAADSVLFWDRAELLACMALDWLSGTLQTNWWWREFFRNADRASSVLKQWTSTPEFVPAALSLLSQRSQAVAFVRSLPEQVCRELLQSIIRAHGIAPPGAALIKDENLPGEAEGELGVGVFAGPRLAPKSPQTSPAPPWLPWIVEASAAGFSPAKRVFLAQALMLVRSPSRARSMEFQSNLLRWQKRAGDEAATGTTGTGIGAGTEASAAHASQLSKAGAHSDDLRSSASLVAKEKPHLLPRERAARDGVSAEDLRLARRQPSDLPDRNPSISVPPVAGPLHPAEDRSAAHEANERLQFSDLAGDDSLLSPPSPLAGQPRDEKLVSGLEHQAGIAVETRFGGCFLLLNVFLHLNLYSDFTSPGARNLELNIWDLLALVADEFTQGAAAIEPLGEILTALAGRSQGELPGAAFTPPREWHLPPEWLDAFPEPYVAEPVERDGRLASIHPAGFAISDVALDAGRESLDLDPLHRWLRWLAAYLRARLVRATGRTDAVDLLCRLPGRVAFTSTHVDVTFSLNGYPIELRLAGLDRDPGWIPAAGHYVVFHFE